MIMNMDIDAIVDSWTNDCYSRCYEMRNQCPVCSEHFYDDGVEKDGVVFCSEECLKEFEND